MFKVIVAFLIFAIPRGTDQYDTDSQNSLAGIKSDIKALQDLLVDCGKKLEQKFKWPLFQNAECRWNKLNEPVVTNGILIPGAQSIEKCQYDCQRTPGCLYFDWIVGLRLCYLPVQPIAVRYELNCDDTTLPMTTHPQPTPTMPETDNPTQPPTMPKTDNPTQPPTMPNTENPTQPPTMPETDNPTQLATTNPRPLCKARSDLAFVVDGSTSICDNVSPCQNWDFNRQFIHKIIDGLTIGPDDSRIALVMFSNQAWVEWDFNKYTNKTSVLSAIDELVYPKGVTNTTGALKTLVSNVFTPTAGDRPDVPNTSIMITDGIPTVGLGQLPAAINAVKSSGIKMLVVGVTNAVDAKTVRQISSSPQKLNVTYFLAKDYSSIDLVRGELQKQTCTP